MNRLVAILCFAAQVGCGDDVYIGIAPNSPAGKAPKQLWADAAAGPNVLPGEHCTPGTLFPSPFLPGGIAESCSASAEGPAIPNGLDVFRDDIALPAPLETGKHTAVSFEMRHLGKPSIVELWSADAACGAPSELLWWSNVESRVFCADFTPTIALSHLLLVQQPLERGDFSGAVGGIKLCTNGECANGGDGHGRSPGVDLSLPLVQYSHTSRAFDHGWDFDLERSGRMVLIGDGSSIAAGYFKMPATDPYGDGWYCVGPGSSVSEVDANVYEVALENVTRLGPCASRRGAGTASITASTSADITSTFPELAGTAVGIGETSCNGSTCTSRYDNATTGAWSWLEVLLRTGDGGGAPFSGSSRVSDIDEAAWFTASAVSTAAKVSCAGSGSVSYDPRSSTRIDVDGMSDFVACPGDAISANSARVRLY